MVKLRRLVSEDKPDILAYGCAAHGGNLLSKSICKLDQNKEILRKSIHIAKYFTYHQAPNGWYRKEGGLKLKIPMDVRWNTYTDHLQSYLDNHNILLKVCIEYEGDDKLDPLISKLLFYFLYFGYFGFFVQ